MNEKNEIENTLSEIRKTMSESKPGSNEEIKEKKLIILDKIVQKKSPDKLKKKIMILYLINKKTLMNLKLIIRGKKSIKIAMKLIKCKQKVKIL